MFLSISFLNAMQESQTDRSSSLLFKAGICFALLILSTTSESDGFSSISNSKLKAELNQAAIGSEPEIALYEVLSSQIGKSPSDCLPHNKKQELKKTIEVCNAIMYLCGSFPTGRLTIAAQEIVCKLSGKDNSFAKWLRNRCELEDPNFYYLNPTNKQGPRLFIHR